MAETLATRDAIANSTLVWCGVSDPTPTEFELACLAADAAIDTIRFYRKLDFAPSWQMGWPYILREVVQPVPATGQLYICTTAGITDDEAQPTWVLDDDGTVTDGSVVWTPYTRDFEARYVSLAVEMATYLYQKRGVDGTTSFGENGVQRSFEKGSFPPSMLARITLPAETG